MARQGVARRGLAGCGRAGRGEVRHGKARRGEAGLGMARQGEANLHLEDSMAKTSRVKEDRTQTESVMRNVILRGIADIMFDRYPGENSTKLEAWQKLYYGPDAKTIVLPALNIVSFLSAHNTNSAPKRLLDKRAYKDVANALLSYTAVSPMEIPFLRDGRPIMFGKFDGDKDPLSGCYIHRAVARLDKGIPNPKVRPVLPLPWALAFNFTIFPNKEVAEQQIINLFDNGGRALGLGTFRGVFGKFEVERWD